MSAGAQLAVQLCLPAPWALELSPPIRRAPQTAAARGMPRGRGVQVTLPVVRECELRRDAPPSGRKCSPFARARTQNFGKLSLRRRREMSSLSLWGDVSPADLRAVKEQRPKTRADCAQGIRPCPFVGCRHHMALVADLERDSLKEVFPELRIVDDPEGPGLQFLEEMIGTCSLDVADGLDDGTQGVGGLISLYQAASQGKALGQTPGMTIKETGRANNLSVERVRQLAGAAMQEVRVKFRRFG